MSLKKASNNLKIVFFGNGQTSLEALQSLNEYFDIELVITKPPAVNSAGRKFKNNVQDWSEKNSLKVITPSTKEELYTELCKYKIDSQLGVVLDFGMIIPGKVIELFSQGILNSHFSLLPKYRGADPIRAAILSGDKTTGVTIIKISTGLDDGPILTWSEQPIDNLNAIELRAKLSELNCALLPETIRLYLEDSLEQVAQDPTSATHTKKTSKSDGIIDPDKYSTELENEVRAYIGWPKSIIEINHKSYIILSAKSSTAKIPKGELRAIDNKLLYGCEGGSLQIEKIQPQGKTSMDAASFINGYLRNS